MKTSPTIPAAETVACLWLKTGQAHRIARFQPAQFQLVCQYQDEPEERIDLGYAGSRVLERLLASPGEVVSRQDLLSYAWENRVVSQGSLNQQIYTLRQLLSDSTSQIIQTLPRRGYCFNPDCVLPAQAQQSTDLPEHLSAAVSEPVSGLQQAVKAPDVGHGRASTPRRARIVAWGTALLATLVLSATTAGQLVNGTARTGSVTHHEKIGQLQVVYIDTSETMLNELRRDTYPVLTQLGAKGSSMTNLVVSLSRGFYEFRCLHPDGQFNMTKVHKALLETDARVQLEQCLPAEAMQS
ncbi:winged helix-turn-helix domain-containing protein [Pseudomonas sp. Marseille-QA0892]